MNDYSNTKLLINEIFLKNTNGKFSNLIKNTQHIPTLLSFLLNTNEKEQVTFYNTGRNNRLFKFQLQTAPTEPRDLPKTQHQS
jgi:hypothetical protein